MFSYTPVDAARKTASLPPSVGTLHKCSAVQSRHADRKPLDDKPDLLSGLPVRPAGPSSMMATQPTAQNQIFSPAALLVRGRPDMLEPENEIRFTLPPLGETLRAQDLAGDTIYDTRFRRTLRPEVRHAMLLQADEAIHTLGVLLLGSVSRCLNQVDAPRHPFSGVPAREALRFFLENTRERAGAPHSSNWAARLLCGAPTKKIRSQPNIDQPPAGMSCALFDGVVGFWKQIAKNPDPAAVDAYLEDYNAGVVVDDQLNPRRLERMFSAGKFVKLQEKFNASSIGFNDYEAFFNTTAAGIPTRFHSIELSNGQSIHENQVALAVTQTFANLKIDRVSAGEWYVTLGLLLENLMRIYNDGRLNIPEHQQSMAVELMGSMIEQMQEDCSQPGGIAVSRLLHEAADQVVSAKLPMIRRNLLGRQDLTLPVQEDMTIADYRERQVDLAKKTRSQAYQLQEVISKDNLWAQVGGWMRRLLESMTSAVELSPGKIIEHDATQRVRTVVNGFIQHFRDPIMAAADFRPQDHVPFFRWDPATRTRDRYLYLTPSVCIHLMKMACGGAVPGEIGQIWETIKNAAGLPCQWPDPLFDSIIFDLAFAELRTNGTFAGKEDFCQEVALCRRNCLKGSLRLERFQKNVLHLVAALERDVNFKAKFDDDYYSAVSNEYSDELSEAQEADQAEIDKRPAPRPLSSQRRQYLQEIAAPVSMHAPSRTGDSARSTVIEEVGQMHDFQRVAARTTAALPGGEETRPPSDIIRQGQVMDRLRSDVHQKINRKEYLDSSSV